MEHRPPAFAKKILQRCCHLDFLEEIEGDLEEQFYERLSIDGLFKARLYYCTDVLTAIIPYRIKRNVSNKTSAPALLDSLSHFIKVASRNLWRSKSSSLINITGLAISLTSFLLIYLYLIDESTYDSFHPNSQNVYRISYSYLRYGDGTQETDARAAGLWAVALKESFPEVKRFTRFSRFGYPGFVKYEKEDKVFIEQQFFWTDPNYTDIFSLPLAAGGEASSILKNPQNVIINETIANKYFGQLNPIGQPLVYSRDGMHFNLIVAGIMKNYPSNSHFHPDFIASNLALESLWKRTNEDRVNSWLDSFTYSFVELDEGTDLSKITKGLKHIFDQHFGENAKTATPILTRLTDLHFTPGMLIELEPPGDRVYLYIFGSIGILILFIASINYMNLATARSVKRSKEVGLRKTLGVSRVSLIFQFLGESLLIVGISFVLSVVLLIILLPAFNELTTKSFSLHSLLQGNILWPLTFLIFALSVISGSYPAFYLSNFRPADVLKGKFNIGRGGENFRKILVVFQFTVTLLLIVSAGVIHHQLSFINTTKLSEYKDQILTIRVGGSEMEKIENFRQMALQNPMVKETALGNHLPRLENFGWIDQSFTIRAFSETPYIWQQLGVDADFPAMFHLEIIAGRNFKPQNPADTSAYILNESAVKGLGISPEKAIGLILESRGYESRDRIGTVIGVVKDFNYTSVRKPILPLVISGQYKEAETMYIKLEGSQYQKVIQHLTNSWKKVYPSSPFQHWFMNEEFARLYQLELQMGKIFNYFAGFAIIIACLGLFGLASFTVEQKTKEIGIRKVMGASIFQILKMLTTRFVKLILVSFVIGIPLTFYIMQCWLESFAYKIELEWLIFAWAGSLILALTCITVGIESLRAALVNPVDSIRHE